MVDKWTYNGRENKDTGRTVTYDTYDTTYTYIGGSTATIATQTVASCPANTAKLYRSGLLGRSGWMN